MNKNKLTTKALTPLKPPPMLITTTCSTAQIGPTLVRVEFRRLFRRPWIIRELRPSPGQVSPFCLLLTQLPSMWLSKVSQTTRSSTLSMWSQKVNWVVFTRQNRADLLLDRNPTGKWNNLDFTIRPSIRSRGPTRTWKCKFSPKTSTVSPFIASLATQQSPSFSTCPQMRPTQTTSSISCLIPPLQSIWVKFGQKRLVWMRQCASTSATIRCPLAIPTSAGTSSKIPQARKLWHSHS